MTFGIKFSRPMNRSQQILKIFLLTMAFAFSSNSYAELFGMWKLDCGKQDYCSLYQGVNNPDNPSIIYSLQIDRDLKQNKTYMRLNLPLGIYLPPGVGVRVGKITKELPMTVCLMSGCAVISDVDKNLVKAMEREARVDMRIFTAQTSAKEIYFLLDGFKEGYKALMAK